MAALISKIRGSHNPIEADLRKTTESGIIDIPEDLLDKVAEASQSEDGRQLIMKHLRECLSEPNGKKWKRVYAALVLTGTLVEKSSPELFRETAEGVHFDIAQRVSLLEHYQPGSAADAQGKSKVRTKASEIRPSLISRLQRAATGEEAAKATDGNSSSSTATGGSANSPSAPAGPAPPAAQLILNGVVAVGHRDDTTSESSGGEDKRRKAVEYRERKQVRKPQKDRRPSGSTCDSCLAGVRQQNKTSYDSEDSGEEDPAAISQRRKAAAGTAKAASPKVATEAQSVDLLGM
jgi:hypothetical protein